LRACCWPSAIAGAILIGSGFAIGPALSSAGSATDATALIELVGGVRGQVTFHRGDHAVRQTSTGWPAAISPAWFRGQALPAHPLTGTPMQVEIVDDAPSCLAPASKTFDPSDGTARALWYNRTNGSVCVRIPHGLDREATLAAFNEANGMSLGALDARR